jgi:hypothetical protein
MGRVGGLVTKPVSITAGNACRLSRGCAAAALCALAATQQGRDFMGIHGPMYGVAVIVKFLQVRRRVHADV